MSRPRKPRPRPSEPRNDRDRSRRPEGLGARGQHGHACRRRRRHLHPALLLSQEAVDRGQLPDVPGRDREGAQADAGLRHAGDAGHDRAHPQRQGAQRAAGGDGVPAHQPPARLPDLRPGRRVPAAGPRGRLRRLLLALRRGQAGRVPEGRRPAHLDEGDEPLHPLHPLRPLRPGGGGGDGARHDPSRRALRDHDDRRRHDRLRALRQHDRHLPGRRAHLEAVPLQRPHLGAVAAQERQPARFDRRQPDRPGQGRAGDARRAAGERGRQRVLARRPRPVLVRGVQRDPSGSPRR